jgi:transcriptional activator Myb
VKGLWKEPEDEQLMELVSCYGAQQWSTISLKIPGRNGKQCRERWHNHVNPKLKKCEWTEAEEWILFLMRRQLNNHNRWA